MAISPAYGVSLQSPLLRAPADPPCLKCPGLTMKLQWRSDGHCAAGPGRSQTRALWQPRPESPRLAAQAVRAAGWVGIEPGEGYSVLHVGPERAELIAPPGVVGLRNANGASQSAASVQHSTVRAKGAGGFLQGLPGATLDGPMCSVCPMDTERVSPWPTTWSSSPCSSDQGSFVSLEGSTSWTTLPALW